MRIIPVVSGRGANPAFQAKIIDGHAHLGKWGERTYGVDNLDKFIKSPIEVVVNGQKSTDTIEKMVVSSAFALADKGNFADELTGNEKMLTMIEGRKEFIPLAVCQPSKTNGDITNIKELFNRHPNTFSGLKFHPTTLPLENDADFLKAYEPYINFAKEKNLPCFFHCQGGQADAWKIYELAQKAPEVPFILGHSGSLAGEGRVNRENAIKVFEDALKTKKANIYMDLSWVDWLDSGFPSKEQPDTRRILDIAYNNNGLGKVVFGTDAPLGCYGEWESPHFNNKRCYSDTVSYLKTTISQLFGKDAEKVSKQIFYSNSKKLYMKKGLFVSPLAKAGAAIAGVVAVGAIGAAAVNKNEDHSHIRHRHHHHRRR